MLDAAYDIAAILFALTCVMVVLTESIPTGRVGSVGVCVCAGAALFSADNSLLDSLERIEVVLLSFMVGLGLLLMECLIRQFRRRRWRSRDAPPGDKVQTVQEDASPLATRIEEGRHLSERNQS